MTMDSEVGVTSSARVIPDPLIAKSQQSAANQALRQFPLRRRALLEAGLRCVGVRFTPSISIGRGTRAPDPRTPAERVMARFSSRRAR